MRKGVKAMVTTEKEHAGDGAGASLSQVEAHALHIVVRDGETDAAILETVPRLRALGLVELTDEITAGVRWCHATEAGRALSKKG